MLFLFFPNSVFVIIVMPPVRIVRQSSKYLAGKLSKNRPRKSQNIACEFPGCTRTFVQRFNYSDHLNVHEGKRPHACPDCESAFTNRGGLTRHQKRHHNYIPHRHRSNKSKATTTRDEKYPFEVRTVPSSPPSAPTSSSHTTESGKKPQWIDRFADDELTSILPASRLESVSNISEPSTFASFSGSHSLKVSHLSPIAAWERPSDNTSDYTDCYSLEYPPDEHSSDHTIAADELTSTLPASGLESVSDPSEPSTFASISGSHSLYASLLSPISSWGRTSDDTSEYTDWYSLEYPPDEPSSSPSSVASTLHYDYSQPSFAISNPQPTYELPPSLSSTFALNPNYSYRSSPPIRAKQESTFHDNTYSRSGEILNLDHWYQSQFQSPKQSTPMNYSY